MLPPIIVALSPVIFWATNGVVIVTGPTIAAIPNAATIAAIPNAATIAIATRKSPVFVVLNVKLQDI
jgi:MinD-like ATPase involved in chromosome partitioning or flagellar assembly